MPDASSPRARPQTSTGHRRRSSRTRAGVALAAAALAGMTALPMTTAAAASGDPSSSPVSRAAVAPALASQLAAGGTADFWVRMIEKADTSPARSVDGKAARGAMVYTALTQTASRSQAPVRAVLDRLDASYQSFWITNAVLVRGGDLALAQELARVPGVAAVDPTESIQLDPMTPGTGPGSVDGVDAIEWGIADINADDVWAQYGVRGEGIVVANIDTGVDFDHPALVNQYRGNLGGGTFDHNYNWFDPSDVCAGVEPCDNNNHGTHTMGTMVGDDGAGNQVGVAPGATWIAAKGCESSSCSDFALLASGQWIVAPTDLNGQNPRPDLAPDIVNNSWGGGGGDPWYDDIVSAWTAAGIFGRSPTATSARAVDRRLPRRPPSPTPLARTTSTG